MQVCQYDFQFVLVGNHSTKSVAGGYGLLAGTQAKRQA
jgi:hypothetical protein